MGLWWERLTGFDKFALGLMAAALMLWAASPFLPSGFWLGRKSPMPISVVVLLILLLLLLAAIISIK